MGSDIPACLFEFDGVTCYAYGDHFCEPRADKAVGFIEEVCVHTKSVYARKPFILEDWQRDDIIRPLFGTIRWSDQFGGCYVRQYTIAHIELGRGNGKSELAAAIVLLLLIADGEESAEIYGAAKTTKQAGKVGEVAKRMMELSPVLTERLKHNAQSRRLYDPVTNSYYEVIAADAENELGHNASGIVIDEFLTQADPDLFDALRTSQGKRPQSLIVCFSTAGQTDGFAYEQHKEMLKVAEDPSRSPHTFVYLRNVPMDADPWDESLWYMANPALGKFLSLDTLRNEAADAKNDPVKEAAFRQFRLNQWVSNVKIWMPEHVWDATSGYKAHRPDDIRNNLRGRVAWGGFDLASKLDLCAWSLLVLPENPNDPIDVVWRFWIPERPIRDLDAATSGNFSKWIRDGWIRVAGNNSLDYDAVYEDIREDAANFDILGVGFDEFGTLPVAQQLEKIIGLGEDSFDIYKNVPQRMTPGLEGLMGLALEKKLHHHQNPVAKWCFMAAEIKSSPAHPDQYSVVKPDRKTMGKRVDAVPAAVMAWNIWWSHGNNEIPTSAYADGGDLFIV